MMIALLASVIQLSLTSQHGTDEARMNIQLMQEFLKAPFLVLYFSYYTLMIFLNMLSVILLSMLMILSIECVTGHLISSNNLNRLLNFNLIYETLWTGVRSGLLISMLGKLSWFWCENEWVIS